MTTNFKMTLSSLHRHRNSNMFPNDENAIPRQQLGKHLSAASSSSGVSKTKKGLSLKPIINSGNNNTSKISSFSSGSSNDGFVTFPKTPSGNIHNSSGKNNTRRRALGDISNRKGANSSSNHNGNGKSQPSKSTKGKGGLSRSGGLTIHNDNLKSGLKLSGGNRNSLSTKKSIKKKKKNVTFNEQIYQDILGDISNGNGSKSVCSNEIRKVLRSKPMESQSMKASAQTKSSLRSRNLNNEADDVEDIEMLSGRSLKEELERINSDQDLQPEADSLIIDIHEFDDREHRRLREEEEYNEQVRKVDESFDKAPEDMYRYEEVEHFQFKVFEDEVCDDLVHYMVDNVDDDHFSSHNNLGLVDISI